MNKPRRSTPKSIRTRQAIETAAQELFRANGFDRVTVRDIAKRANIDPSMIIRYFGSKDALFAQVAMPDLQLPDLRKVERSLIGETLVRHFMAQWEGEQAGGGLAILLRSAASNEDAAGKLREVFAAQVLPAILSIPSASPPAQRAGLVATQLLGLALTRYVLKIPPVVAMPEELIVREIAGTIQRYATGER
jgi:AcrR family transcriptional regulator